MRGGANTMKKTCSCLITILIVFSALIFNFSSTLAADIEPLAKNHLVILMPGITRNINITQDSDTPQASSNILILVLGYGGVTINWNQLNNNDGDLLVLSGIGLSSAGPIPILKILSCCRLCLT